MGSNRHYIKRGISYLKRNGMAKSAVKAIERLVRDGNEKDYRPPVLDEDVLRAQREHVFSNPYRFSILVPVYETDPGLFRRMLKSVADQTYGNWELILADASRDDERRSLVRDFTEEYSKDRRDRYGELSDKVRYIWIGKNLGISGNTNEALKHASGDYIGLLDHDDLLAPDALFEIQKAIDRAESESKNRDSIFKVMAVYTDEDKVSEDGKNHFDPHYKPDFDPVLLCTNNYICHFFVADINLAKSVGGFGGEYDGAQDHDFILRCTEGLHRDRVIHIPRVLYHWRSTKDSTAEDPNAKLYAYEAGKRAVSDHMKRAGISATVTDSPHLGFFDIDYNKLHANVTSITAREYEECKDRGEGLPDSEFVMILSEDLKPCDPTYIEDMMSVMNLPYVGAVTGKITGRSGKIESAGIKVLPDGSREPEYAGLYHGFSGYLHRASLHRLTDDFSGDCVLVRKDAVEEWFPKITLKDRFLVYYTPRAEFRRRKR